MFRHSISSASAAPPSHSDPNPSSSLSLSPLIRPAASFKEHSFIPLPERCHVSIHHPAYARRSEMFALLAYDYRVPHHGVSDDGVPELEPGECGVHFDTVLAACAIVACNMPGYLARERGAQHTRIVMEPDAILPAGKYYYYLDGTSHQDKYPVCPSFGEWVFEATCIPQSWYRAAAAAAVCKPPSCEPPTSPTYAESHASDAVRYRDVVCLVSGYADSVQVAHLVPDSELAWFETNDMHKYNSDRMRFPQNPARRIDDPGNMFLLRSDIHGCMDQQAFALVYKNGALVVHFVQAVTHLAKEYHNCQTGGSRHASREGRTAAQSLTLEFVWARFAWTVLPLVRSFASMEGHNVQIMVDDSGDLRTLPVGSPETVELLEKRSKKLTGETKLLKGLQAKPATKWGHGDQNGKKEAKNRRRKRRKGSETKDEDDDDDGGAAGGAGRTAETRREEEEDHESRNATDGDRGDGGRDNAEHNPSTTTTSASCDALAATYISAQKTDHKPRPRPSDDTLSSQTPANTGTPPNPAHVPLPPSPLIPSPTEWTPEECRKVHRYFPEMLHTAEEKWSPSYTWQQAQWYPGLDKVESLKRKVVLRDRMRHLAKKQKRQQRQQRQQHAGAGAGANGERPPRHA